MLSTPSKSTWLVFPQPNPFAKSRLLAFPFAGSGAFAYRSWAQRLPADVELVIVQLPGRENRLKEAPLRRADAVVAALLPELTPLVDKPMALFGHSLGAMLAYELAWALSAETPLTLSRLHVSGRGAPHTPLLDAPAHNLDDAAFINRLRALNGTAESVLQNQELMRLLLPMLRADFEMNEVYKSRPRPALPIPISAYYGTEDVLVTQETMAAWGIYTSVSFDLYPLAGDHFFFQAPESPFWQVFPRATPRP